MKQVWQLLCVLQGHARFKMKDIIALDLDSVLGDTDIIIDKFMQERFGLYLDWATDIQVYEFERWPCLTSGMVADLEEFILSGELAHTIQVFGHAKPAMDKLVKAGFSIYIITARPLHLESMTLEWLKKNDLYYDKLYIVGESIKKPPIIKAHNIKAFIEDRFDVLKWTLDHCGPLDRGLYCVRYPWNSKFHNDHITKVAHVEEAVDIIINEYV